MMSADLFQEVNRFMVRIFAVITCDLSQELVQRYDVRVIPLHIVLGQEEYRDGEDLSPDQIYSWSDRHQTTPKTSAVSLEDSMKAFRPVLDAGDEIIVFCISEQMSVTGNVFRMTAEEMGAADRVSVIDSQNLSTGIGLMVIEAAIRAQAGEPRAQIVSEIEAIRGRVRASFVVDTLTYLHRGGRCSSVAALAGSVLKLHPMIVVENGAMHADKKYRGKMSSVIMSYARDLEPALKTAVPDRVFITHSGCTQDVIDGVHAYLESLGRFREILVTRAGGVISSHCGPGTLGVLFIAGE